MYEPDRERGHKKHGHHTDQVPKQNPRKAQHDVQRDRRHGRRRPDTRDVGTRKPECVQQPHQNSGQIVTGQAVPFRGR